MTEEQTGKKRIAAGLTSEELSDIWMFTLEHIHEAVYWIKPDASLVFVNQAAINMLGYTRAELLQMSVTDINNQMDADGWRNTWEELRRLNHLTGVSEHVSKAGVKIPVEVNATIAELENLTLSCAVVRDISDRRKLELRNTELLQNEQELEAIIRAQEAESQRIARDLHDSVGQLLSTAKLHAEVLSTHLVDSEQGRKAIRSLKAVLKESIYESKRVSMNLLPVALEDFGVVTALEQMCENLGRETKTSLKFYCNDLDLRLDEQRELLIYRIAQESVNNAFKHAGASHIELQLISKSDQVVLSVVDNGCGFDMERLGKGGPSVGIGMRNLCHRTILLNGHIEIDTEPGKGTRIVVRVPRGGETE